MATQRPFPMLGAALLAALVGTATGAPSVRADNTPTPYYRAARSGNVWSGPVSFNWSTGVSSTGYNNPDEVRYSVYIQAGYQYHEGIAPSSALQYDVLQDRYTFDHVTEDGCVLRVAIGPVTQVNASGTVSTGAPRASAGGAGTAWEERSYSGEVCGYQLNADRGVIFSDVNGGVDDNYGVG